MRDRLLDGGAGWLRCRGIQAFLPDDHEVVRRGVAKLLHAEPGLRVRDPLAALSEQERTVSELIGEGFTNREIGERMFLAAQAALLATEQRRTRRIPPERGPSRR